MLQATERILRKQRKKFKTTDYIDVVVVAGCALIIFIPRKYNSKGEESHYYYKIMLI